MLFPFHKHKAWSTFIGRLSFVQRLTSIASRLSSSVFHSSLVAHLPVRDRTQTGHSSLQRGFVLLVVLGLLALMSALALAFVAMAKLERQVARNYVERMHAIMAAESGIEYAI